MSNFTTMTDIANAAKSNGDQESLTYGFADGVISGHEVECIAVQVRTNGRCLTQLTWKVDGKRSSKTKVAAL